MTTKKCYNLKNTKMEAAGDRLIEPNVLHPGNIAVIREVYDNEYAHDQFSNELERALDSNCTVIIIEPKELGDETAYWIAAGNCLQKTAVLSGLGAIFSGFIWSDRALFSTPLITLSLFCTGLYTVSWQFDPCVKYQVEHDSRRLARLPLLSVMASSSPVVLVRKDDTRKKVFQCSTISILAAVFCAYRIYQSTK